MVEDSPDYFWSAFVQNEDLLSVEEDDDYVDLSQNPFINYEINHYWPSNVSDIVSNNFDINFYVDLAHIIKFYCFGDKFSKSDSEQTASSIIHNNPYLASRLQSFYYANCVCRIMNNDNNIDNTIHYLCCIDVTQIARFFSWFQLILIVIIIILQPIMLCEWTQNLFDNNSIGIKSEETRLRVILLIHFVCILVINVIFGIINFLYNHITQELVYHSKHLDYFLLSSIYSKMFFLEDSPLKRSWKSQIQHLLYQKWTNAILLIHDKLLFSKSAAKNTSNSPFGFPSRIVVDLDSFEPFFTKLQLCWVLFQLSLFQTVYLIIFVFFNGVDEKDEDILSYKQLILSKAYYSFWFDFLVLFVAIFIDKKKSKFQFTWKVNLAIFFSFVVPFYIAISLSKSQEITAIVMIIILFVLLMCFILFNGSSDLNCCFCNTENRNPEFYGYMAILLLIIVIYAIWVILVVIMTDNWAANSSFTILHCIFVTISFYIGYLGIQWRTHCWTCDQYDCSEKLYKMDKNGNKLLDFTVQNQLFLSIFVPLWDRWQYTYNDFTGEFEHELKRPNNETMEQKNETNTANESEPLQVCAE